MLRKSARFLRHLFKAKSRFGIHSPFVFEFVTQVLPHQDSAIGGKIEALRRACARSNERLEIEDFGAGYAGKARPKIEKTMAQIVRSSARQRREGELLHRICQHYQPAACLELGSNLGFSTLYQASALRQSRFISLEGSASLLAKARSHADKFGLSPEWVETEFSSGLDQLLSDPELRFDYILMDGNHRFLPTIDYFERLLPRMNPGAILILDDINWSMEMEKAWREIAKRPEVTVSLDLFFLGICFIQRPQQKQHFNLHFRP